VATNALYVSSQFHKSSQFQATEIFLITQKWNVSDDFDETVVVPSAPIRQSHAPVSLSLNQTLEELESVNFAISTALVDSNTIPLTRLPPTALIEPTRLPPSQTLIYTDCFTDSESGFEETQSFKPSGTIVASQSFSQSKTFLRSPDFIATDSFMTTVGLLDQAGAVAGSAALETPVFVAFAAGALALLVIAILAIWRFRRGRELAMVPEAGDEEVMTEFTWEAQVDNVFTTDACTYQNPSQNSLWETAGHFTRVLTENGNDDPFTQFE
jgi:hypothetical protein